MSAKRKMAAVAASAAWNMAKWENMEAYVQFLSPDTVNGNFYRAVLEIHKNNFDTSQVFVSQALFNIFITYYLFV
jgi:FKBP12-rapamycin complex-associated protein